MIFNSLDHHTKFISVSLVQWFTKLGTCYSTCTPTHPPTKLLGCYLLRNGVEKTTSLASSSLLWCHSSWIQSALGVRGCRGPTVPCWSVLCKGVEHLGILEPTVGGEVLEPTNPPHPPRTPRDYTVQSPFSFCLNCLNFSICLKTSCSSIKTQLMDLSSVKLSPAP